MRQVIKHRDIRLLNMIRRTDPVIPYPLSYNYGLPIVSVGLNSVVLFAA